MKPKLIFWFFMALALIFTNGAKAAIVQWSGSGYWSYSTNWSTGSMPTAADTVVFNSGNASCTLDVSASVGGIVFSNGYTGEFHFKNTLSVFGDADFRTSAFIFTYTGILEFMGPSPHTFFPKANAYTANQIVLNGSGGTRVKGNGFQCVNLSLNNGLLHLDSALVDSVSGSITSSVGGGIDFGKSTLKFAGQYLNLSSFNSLIPSFGALEFCGNTFSKQQFTPRTVGIHPRIIHSGNDTLLQLGPLTCRDFLQSNGTYDINGSRDTITNGNFSVVNGTSKSLAGLANSYIVVLSGGSADFSGQSGDYLNMVSGSIWHVQVLGGGLSATYANIENCDASGGAPGYATNSVNLSSNPNWTFMASNLKIWNNMIGDGKWSTGANWAPPGVPSPADSVVFNATSACSMDVSASVKSLRFSPSFTAIFKFLGNTLSIADSADFSMLTGGSIDVGTGTIEFIGPSMHTLRPKPGMFLPNIRHTGTGVLKLMGDLFCSSFYQQGGILYTVGFSIMTPGDFVIVNGTSTTIQGLGTGLDSIVASSATLKGLAGDTLNLDRPATWRLHVSGPLSVDFAKIKNCIASCSTGYANNSVNGGANPNWKFGKFWRGSAGDYQWTTVNNWMPPAPPQPSDSVVFDNSGTYGCVLNASANVRAITFTSGYTQQFDFQANALTVGGTADLRSTGPIVPGTGALQLTSNANTWLYTRPNNPMPKILKTGSGSIYVSDPNRLVSLKMVVSNGMLEMYAPFTIDSIQVVSPGTLMLDNAVIRNDTVKAISGNGSFNLGWASLFVSGDASLSQVASVITTDKTKIIFTGIGSQIFAPPANVTFPSIVKEGSGTTTIGVRGFSVDTLEVVSGTFNFGSNLLDSVKAKFSCTGSLDFASCTLAVGAVSMDLNACSAIAAGAGVCKFIGASSQTVFPKAGAMHPSIVCDNATGIFIAGSPLKAYSMTLQAGSISFADASAFHDSIGMISAIAGSAKGLDLGNDTVNVEGLVLLPGATVTSQPTAALRFVGSGTQNFLPSELSPHPNIVHCGSGVLNQTGPLTCRSFLQTAGSYNINGYRDTVTAGDFTIVNGSASSVTGLDGAVIVVPAGNASFSGQSASRCALSPASPWRLDVAGTKSAQYANIGNCDASGGPAGVPWHCSMGTGNSNWDTSSVSPHLFDTSGASAYLFASQRNDGSDTIDIYFQLKDADDVIDTIVLQYRNGQSGAWSPANFISGDVGTVSAIDSSLHRHIRWNCREQFGNSFVSDSLQLKVWAIDPYFNKTSMMTPNKNFTVSTQLPGAPSIAFSGAMRFTNNPSPALSVSAANSDSMRFRLDAGTWSSWEPYATSKSSFAISAGGEGLRKVYVEFKDRTGNATGPVSDSIVYDTTAPACSIATRGNFSFSTWLGGISGIASDNLSGVSNVSVQLKHEIMGYFWNGSGWVLDSQWTIASATPAWHMGIPAISLEGGRFTVQARAFDSAGNVSAIVRDSFSLAARPNNTLISFAAAIHDTALSIAWITDTTNRVMKNVLFGCGPAVNLPDSNSLAPLPYRDTSFIVVHTVLPGTWYVLTRSLDSAGNVSPLRIDSVIIMNSPPALIVPHDTSIDQAMQWVGKLSALDVNGDSVHFSIERAPSGLIIDSVQGVMRWTPGAADAGSITCIVNARDQRGGVAVDTFTIVVRMANKPAGMLFLGDSIAHEDSLFSARIRLNDPNAGDSASFAVIRVPSWMRLAGDSLIGTPGANDIGVHTLMFIAKDKGGLLDTLQKSITVLHTNHTPIIVSWSGPDSMRQYGRAQWSLLTIDKDAGDSLAVTWLMKPEWLSAATADTVGTQRRFTFTAAPTSGDRGWVGFAFSVHDAAGAAVTVKDSIFIIGLPTTIIGQRQISFGALRYSVIGGNGKEPAAAFEASLRSLDDTSLTITQKKQNGIFDFYPLIDGRYEFQARAIDARGLRDTMPPKDIVAISGASRHAFSDTSWTMLSVPCIAFSVTALAGSGHVLHWDESSAEENIYRYYRREQTMGQTAPGLSYWRKSTDTLAISFKAGDMSDTAEAVVRVSKGAYGWNQVASPYPYPIKWPSDATVWKWNSGTNDYEDAGGVLEPWQGYWVMADSNEALHIGKAPVFSTGAASKRSSTYFTSKADWRLRVSLSGREGNDADNILGFSPGASDGWDIADRPEPPRLSDVRYAYFWHPEWGRSVKEFASDVRRLMKPVNAFQIGIAPSQSHNEAVRIHFHGIENLPSLYCYYADTDTVFLVEGNKEYELSPSPTTVYKTIFVTADRNYLKHFPLRFILNQPLPNPCRPRAVISYTLPYRFAKNGLLNAQPYTVRLALYDVMGRRVRQLLAREQEPGSYRVVWDGKNASGRIAAPGTYFCRLEANEYLSTVRLTMMK